MRMRMLYVTPVKFLQRLWKLYSPLMARFMTPEWVEKLSQCYGIVRKHARVVCMVRLLTNVVPERRAQ